MSDCCVTEFVDLRNDTCVFFIFIIDINSMPHYTAILHALHNLSFSFTITFTLNNNKTIVVTHYNIDNNIIDV